MTDGSVTPVSVSRRIQAPAAELFAVLADPARHPGIDGSGMLRRPGGSQTIGGQHDHHAGEAGRAVRQPLDGI
jgi:hypothetical protein